VSRENSLMRRGKGHDIGILPLALTPSGRSRSVRMTGLNSGAVPSPTHFEFANVICSLICAAARDGMSLGRGFLVCSEDVVRRNVQSAGEGACAPRTF
jgi:hypothetical protein